MATEISTIAIVICLDSNCQRYDTIEHSEVVEKVVRGNFSKYGDEPSLQLYASDMLRTAQANEIALNSYVNNLIKKELTSDNDTTRLALLVKALRFIRKEINKPDIYTLNGRELYN